MSQFPLNKQTKLFHCSNCQQVLNIFLHRNQLLKDARIVLRFMTTTLLFAILLREFQACAEEHYH